MSRAGKSYKFIYEIILKTRRFGLLSAYSCPDAAGVACSLLTLNRPVVIDCQIDSDDKVWPMVAPGAAISEAFDEDDM